MTDFDAQTFPGKIVDDCTVYISYYLYYNHKFPTLNFEVQPNSLVRILRILLPTSVQSESLISCSAYKVLELDPKKWKYMCDSKPRLAALPLGISFGAQKSGTNILHIFLFAS